MNYGFYAAFLGMRARQRTLDAISNNIANSSTAGYKAERLVYRSVEAAEVERLRAEEKGLLPSGSFLSSPGAEPPSGQIQPGNLSAEQADLSAPPSRLNRAFGTVTGSLKDLSTGSFRETGNPLDLALAGDGYFVVQTPRGERYTRAGSFTLDANGQLVTQQGELVVGEGGPITVPAGEITVSDDGTISVNGRTVDRLKIVSFRNPQAALVKEGESQFAAASGARAAEAVNVKVRQGTVESSNVNVVSQMAAMMHNSREFDSLERSIKLMMDIRRAASEIGRI
jgi:flagellar basal-body rod protein FlgF